MTHDETSEADPNDVSRAPLPPPPGPVSRRLDLPWPRYRYVPGRGVHPLRAGGHGGCGLDSADPIERALDRGLDLIAAHYVWEAHEALEIAWRACALTEPGRVHTAAVVKLCAAVLRKHLGDDPAARRLLNHARRALAPDHTVRDLDAAALIAAVQRFVDGDGPLDLRCAARAAD